MVKIPSAAQESGNRPAVGHRAAHTEVPIPVTPVWFAPSSGAFAVRVVIFFAILVAVIALWKSMTGLLIVFAACFIAVMLRTIAGYLGKILPLGNSALVLLSTLLIILAICLAFATLGAQITDQIEQLAQRLPEDYNQVVARLGQDRVNSFIPSSSTLASFAQSQASNLSSFMSALLLAVLGGLYLALDPVPYQRGLMMVLPGQARQPVSDALAATGTALRHWLPAECLIMVIVGSAWCVGLSLIGLPSALALGLMAGLLEFVPVIGPFMAAVPALLIAATMGGEMILWTGGVILAVEALEGNILWPLVMRRSVAIPPAVGLFALCFFGSIFGLTGVLLGGPLTVVCYVLVKELWIKHGVGEPALPDATNSSGDKSEA